MRNRSIVLRSGRRVADIDSEVVEQRIIGIAVVVVTRAKSDLNDCRIVGRHVGRDNVNTDGAGRCINRARVHPDGCGANVTYRPKCFRCRVDEVDGRRIYCAEFKRAKDALESFKCVSVGLDVTRQDFQFPISAKFFVAGEVV